MNVVFARQDEGQAIVIVALAMVLLMGALMLGVDWGYRLAASRTTQNGADAAALAAGRALATRYSGTAFDLGGPISQEEVWGIACRARNANAVGAPSDAAPTLTVSFYAADDTPLGEVESSDASENATCTLVANTTAIDPLTRYVRVLVDSRFHSLFGMVTRQELRALSVARVRLSAGAAVRPLVLPPAGDVGTPGDGLSGFSTKPNAAIWPIVVRAGESWTGSPRFRLIWNDDPTGGAYYVSFAHYSPHEGQQSPPHIAHQLVTESDYTASAHAEHGHPGAAPIANTADPSCGTTWDSFGPTTFSPSPSPLDVAGRCNVPNWFHYGFRGSVSVNTDWTSWTSYLNYGDHAELGTPSVGAGDWLETVPASYVNSDAVINAITSFIQTYGRDIPGDPGNKAVVVNLFEWDCGESYNIAGAKGDRWNLNGGLACATDPGVPARVHITGVVPVTVRLVGDIRPMGHPDVFATWGGIFGDPGACQRDPTVPACDLNPYINSAFLVPDE